MSKTVDRALESVQKSEFIFRDNNQIEVRNAFVFWTNFRGEANKFGNKARTFNLAIKPEVAEILNAQGWRVRDVDSDEQKLYFVNIKVNMASSYPPIITLFTKFRGKGSRRPIDIETIGELDRIVFESCDLIINPFASKQYPGKVSGYLKKLNVIQEADIEFGGKYDDWMEETDVMDDISEE